MLGLGLATFADIHFLASEAHVSVALQGRRVANCAGHSMVLYFWLLRNLLLLDDDGDLLLNLGLNHFDEELLVLRVHSAGASTATAWLIPSLLSLPAVASEARN